MLVLQLQLLRTSMAAAAREAGAGTHGRLLGEQALLHLLLLLLLLRGSLQHECCSACAHWNE